MTSAWIHAHPRVVPTVLPHHERGVGGLRPLLLRCAQSRADTAVDPDDGRRCARTGESTGDGPAAGGRLTVGARSGAAGEIRGEDDMSQALEGGGCQIILVAADGAVLLQLRDDKDWIPYPGMWAVPGGMLEPGESPLDCIVREVREELGVDLAPEVVVHLETVARSYGVEHTFTAPLDVPADEIVLTEGQRVDWFTPEQVAQMHLAYEDDDVLAAFFAARA